MKRILFILLLLTGLAAQAREYRIATYNLRNANKSDSIGGNAWSKRMPRMAGLIAYHDFDIFGTQEGKYHQLQDLCRVLPEYDYVGAGRDDGRQAGEHSAIFFRKDRFKVLDHGDFWLSSTPERPSIGWDARYKRICTWAKFKDRRNRTTFIVYNLHMDHIGKQARMESAKLVLNRIGTPAPRLPVILMGDFNFSQRDPAYRLILDSGRLEDAYAKAGFRYVLNETPDTRRIDHIFVDRSIEVPKYAVLTDSYLDKAPEKFEKFYFGMDIMSYKGRKPSDHFPVIAIINLK